MLPQRAALLPLGCRSPCCRSPIAAYSAAGAAAAAMLLLLMQPHQQQHEMSRKNEF
jgi:hypothetical protein